MNNFNIKKIKDATAERNRAAKRDGAFGTHTVKDIVELLKIFGNKCVKCGAPWEQIDHVYPLKRGGSNLALNLAPMCERCNKGKASKLGDYRTQQQKQQMFVAFWNQRLWRGNWPKTLNTKKIQEIENKKKKVKKKKKNQKEKIKKSSFKVFKEKHNYNNNNDNNDNSDDSNNSLPAPTVINSDKPLVQRNNQGQYLAGSIGNPSGMSNITKDLRQFLRRKVEVSTLNGSEHKVFDKLCEVVYGPQSHDFMVMSPDFWFKCAKLLLEYTYGKPLNQISFQDKDGNDAKNPIEVQILRFGDQVIKF